jgi:hypothetical protein
MYCYIILCRVEWESNAAAARGFIRYARGSISLRSRLHFITLAASFHYARGFISLRSLHCRSRLHFITLPLAISFHSFISFHSISNVCIYIQYSPASRVCRYSGFQNLPETIYLPEFVRGYGTFAPSSIEVACPDADV